MRKIAVVPDEMSHEQLVELAGTFASPSVRDNPELYARKWATPQERNRPITTCVSPPPDFSGFVYDYEQHHFEACGVGNVILHGREISYLEDQAYLADTLRARVAYVAYFRRGASFDAVIKFYGQPISRFISLVANCIAAEAEWWRKAVRDLESKR